MVCRFFAAFQRPRVGRTFASWTAEGAVPRGVRRVEGSSYVRNLACPRDFGGCIMARNRHV